MFILIDNYDSFTYNLFHYLGELGARLEVHRNDKITPAEVIARHPQGIILSPGPCDPDRAGICLDLIRSARDNVRDTAPILGVCLGHQAIGQAFGGKVIHAKTLMHGKVSRITHNGVGVFKGLPSPYNATRYHSLAIERETCPKDLEVTAWTDDGEIMGVRHRTLAVEGVQFHPESILTEHGHALLRNFLTMQVT